MLRQMSRSQEGKERKVQIKAQQLPLLSKADLVVTSDLYSGGFLGSCLVRLP